MVNPPALVHRPQSRSMMDLVHLLLPRVWFSCMMWSWSELLDGAARDVVGEVPGVPDAGVVSMTSARRHHPGWSLTGGSGVKW